MYYYVADIIIVLIFIIAIIIGIFQNFVFGSINLVLFVGFLFLFNFIAKLILPEIIPDSIYDSYSTGFNDGISALEDYFKNFAEYGITFPGIDAKYNNNAFLEGTLNGASNVVAFIVVACLALLISYGLTWAIYAPLKKLLNKSEWYKNHNKKFYFRILSSVICLFSSALFVSAIISPVYYAQENVEKISSKEAQFKVSGLVTGLDNLKDLTEKIDAVTAYFVKYDGEANNVELKVNELNDLYVKYDSEFDKYIALCKEYADKALVLSANYQLTTQEKATLVGINQALTQAVSEIESYKTQLNQYEPDIKQASELIADAKKQLGDAYAQLESGREQIESAVDQFYTQVDAIDQKITDVFSGIRIIETSNGYFEFDKVFFKFLAFDYGFGSFTYDGKTTTIDEEIDALITYIQDFIRDVFAQINNLIVEKIKEGAKAIDDELNNFITVNEPEIKKQLEEFNNVYTTAKEEIGKYQTQIDEAISAINQIIAKYNEISEKYL